MAGKFLGRNAIVDTIKSEERTNSMQSAMGLVFTSMQQFVNAPIQTVERGTQSFQNVLFPPRSKQLIYLNNIKSNWANPALKPTRILRAA